MLIEYIVSYVNWAVLLLSMFAVNRGPLSFFNDMLLTTAGGSQFVFIHYFGGRITEMVWTNLINLLKTVAKVIWTVYYDRTLGSSAS